MKKFLLCLILIFTSIQYTYIKSVDLMTDLSTLQNALIELKNQLMHVGKPFIFPPQKKLSKKKAEQQKLSQAINDLKDIYNSEIEMLESALQSRQRISFVELDIFNKPAHKIFDNLNEEQRKIVRKGVKEQHENINALIHKFLARNLFENKEKTEKITQTLNDLRKLFITFNMLLQRKLDKKIPVTKEDIQKFVADRTDISLYLEPNERLLIAELLSKEVAQWVELAEKLMAQDLWPKR